MTAKKKSLDLRGVHAEITGAEQQIQINRISASRLTIKLQTSHYFVLAVGGSLDTKIVLLMLRTNWNVIHRVLCSIFHSKESCHDSHPNSLYLYVDTLEQLHLSIDCHFYSHAPDKQKEPFIKSSKSRSHHRQNKTTTKQIDTNSNQKLWLIFI